MQVISVDEIRTGMIHTGPMRRDKDDLILQQDDNEIKKRIESIKDESSTRAVTLITTIVNQFQQHETIDTMKLNKIVKEILDYILGDLRIFFTINKMHTYDKNTFMHSVDVCVFSLLVGSIMGLNHNELAILGIGALLHDIGKIYIDYRIINKPEKLAIEEYEEVKTHARDGYELLRRKVNINFLIPHMAFQHHEREDGSGYPRGLTSKRIHLFSKIIAVADVFDAMTSYRVYRNPVPPSLAIQEICVNAPDKYSPTVVDYFTKIVTPYSKGSVLLLNNNQTVEVLSVSRVKCLVKVISGLYVGETYDLYGRSELNVVKLIS